jgi:NADPH-dependent glutamate synthase beta subunit-like oxidoreductase/CO/xanthine dehydrogenase FAD-binding subunit
MRPFEYMRPHSVDEACAALSRPGARALAGGTDLLGEMKDDIGTEYPEVVVDLKSLHGMNYVRVDEDGLRVGALTRLKTLAEDPAVAERFPALASAASSVASPQIREMGTVAGNICQSTRCWYYWCPDDRFHCIRKGGDACFALAGDNRYHSVYGGVRLKPTPCVSACPSGTEIPYYLRLVQEGDMPGAARRLLANNPLPAITGRVCPHFCEKECNRAGIDQAVSIRALERRVGDFILDNWEQLGLAPAPDTGSKVAVVGAGPAGLSAAFYLRMQGIAVDIYDRFERAGGMLNHAIPGYRLPDSVVDRQVAILETVGVVFHLGVDLGRDLTIQQLRERYNAVFLAIGTWRERELGVGEGAELISGLEYLRRSRVAGGEDPAGRVLVIGGGNVAIDAAITAKRRGARKVTLACLEALPDMPAIASEVEAALEEGIEILPSCGPARLLVSEGCAAGMELMACTSVFNAEGQFAPTYDPGILSTVEADKIVVAIGQQPDIAALRIELPESVFQRGLVSVDSETQETAVPGLFASGDVTSGPGYVTSAMGSGRRAAAGILGRLSVEGVTGWTWPSEQEHRPSSFAAGIPRVASRTVAAGARSMNSEDVAGLTDEQLLTEASRCMDCACVSVSNSDLAPVLVALRAQVKTTTRTLEAAEFFAVAERGNTVLAEGEIVTEFYVPNPVEGTRSSYAKFALRNSIDFPLVGCAIALTTTEGVIDAASICLSAVYGRPYVPTAAQDFLKGKRIDADTAASAALLAVDDGKPLSGNKYKLRIARAMIERGIVACSS